MNQKTGLKLDNKSMGEMGKCPVNLTDICESFELTPSCKNVTQLKRLEVISKTLEDREEAAGDAKHGYVWRTGEQERGSSQASFKVEVF